jgi:hypothetical protein
MFSRYAIDKLREVFMILFATTSKGQGDEKSKEESTPQPIVEKEDLGNNG